MASAIIHILSHPQRLLKSYQLQRKKMIQILQALKTFFLDLERFINFAHCNTAITLKTECEKNMMGNH